MQKGMRDFQIPTKTDVDKETLTPTYGRFTAEPFERGYGTTVGNSLRRVLLSSLTGAAIVSVKIEGVLHEFSTIPGVTEDVTDIILNVKKIRLKLHADKTKTIHLRKKGPGIAKAADIEHDADIELLTPDLHLATLDKGANLDMEMVVKRGRGYVSAERNKEEEMPIGVLPVDALYSPVTRVNYLVENARVGRMTDYDKLILEVYTDGSVSPEDALSDAALIVRGHLDIFINVKDMEETLSRPAVAESISESNKNLLRSVNELELSVRAANCLKNANIKTIADLVQKTEADMLRTKNFGKKSLNEIKEILNEMGLGLGMKLDHLSDGDSSEKREG
jgi:DNA-directed RNA polymerase subunit alpha